MEKYVPGLGPEKRHQNYYQWIYFVLAFQAGLFYLPHFYWKSKEGKLLSRLTNKLNNPVGKEEDKTNQINDTVTYLTRYRGRHQGYYIAYISCEIFNLINVFAQIYMVDKFLGGSFITYGLDVLKFVLMDQEDRFDPMIFIFPHMTKCTFHKFGASGDVQKHDSLCILPLNILNEKIYVIMWFWFLVLGVMSGCWFIYRMMTLINPKLRERILDRRANMVEKRKIRQLVKRIDAGDWFLLSMICKNIDSAAFQKIAHDFLDNLRKERKKKENDPKPIKESKKENKLEPKLEPKKELEIDSEAESEEDSDAHLSKYP